MQTTTLSGLILLAQAGIPRIKAIKTKTLIKINDDIFQRFTESGLSQASHFIQYLQNHQHGLLTFFAFKNT